MTSNDNGVNIKKTAKSYHHGDLRSALVADGLAMLRVSGVDAFSLREVARRIGVSATAVYRHFPDKESFLNAVAAAGTEQLGQMQRIAMDTAGGGIAGFEVAGQTYVRFALANPALFRLMMIAKPGQVFFGEKGAPNIGTGGGNAAMHLLQTSVAALAGEGADQEQTRHRAIHAWSMVHGMAILMLDGLIPQDEATILSIRSEAFAQPDNASGQDTV